MRSGEFSLLDDEDAPSSAKRCCSKKLVTGISAAVLILTALVIAILVISGVFEGSGFSSTRTYFIAAEEIDWVYVDNYTNMVTGEYFTEAQSVYVSQGIGGGPDLPLKKAVYRQYTDLSFTTPSIPDTEFGKASSILGPIIRGVVGDTIIVVFKNLASQPYSIHAHGVFYNKDSEGAFYNDGAGTAGDAVAPGEVYNYTWLVTDRAGPASEDKSSIIWPYHSHVNETGDTNAGLIGAIIITRADSANKEGAPKDVTAEFVTLWKIFDESLSPYYQENLARAGCLGNQTACSQLSPEDLLETAQKTAINGKLFGHCPGLWMEAATTVRWYIIGFGGEEDLHTPHWHGQTLVSRGFRVDTVMVLPGFTMTVDMTPDNQGIWLLHCHVDPHITEGMSALFHVSAPAL